jgi:excisionase family DNA binding protein
LYIPGRNFLVRCSEKSRERSVVADYLKLPEVARRLDVSEKTARRMVKSGSLPAVFIGGAYRISEEALAEYLENAKVEPGKAQAPPSPEQPSLNGLLEEERREHRRAAAVQYGLDDVRLTVARYERYQTMSEKLDEFRKGWEARLETEDFNQAALEEGGRTASAFWPMVTALADFELGDLMRAGYQLEEAAAQSALVPAIERYQALCHRLNSIYREKYEAKIYWLARREAS